MRYYSLVIQILLIASDRCAVVLKKYFFYSKQGRILFLAQKNNSVSIYVI